MFSNLEAIRTEQTTFWLPPSDVLHSVRMEKMFSCRMIMRILRLNEHHRFQLNREICKLIDCHSSLGCHEGFLEGMKNNFALISNHVKHQNLKIISDDMIEEMIHFINGADHETKFEFYKTQVIRCLKQYDATYEILGKCPEGDQEFAKLVKETMKLLKNYIVLLIQVKGVSRYIKVMLKNTTSHAVNTITELRQALKKIQPLQHRQQNYSVAAPDLKANIKIIDLKMDIFMMNHLPSELDQSRKKFENAKSAVENNYVIIKNHQERNSEQFETTRETLRKAWWALGELHLSSLLLTGCQVYKILHDEYANEALKKLNELQKSYNACIKLHTQWLSCWLNNEPIGTSDTLEMPKPHGNIATEKCQNLAPLLYQIDKDGLEVILNYGMIFFAEYFERFLPYTNLVILMEEDERTQGHLSCRCEMFVPQLRNPMPEFFLYETGECDNFWINFHNKKMFHLICDICSFEKNSTVPDSPNDDSFTTPPEFRSNFISETDSPNVEELEPVCSVDSMLKAFRLNAGIAPWRPNPSAQRNRTIHRQFNSNK